MKTILAFALMLATTSAYAHGNHSNNQGHGNNSPAPSAPATVAPSAPATGDEGRDSSAGRTNYTMAEDGVVRKTASNFCVTWARDAYCAKN